MKLTLILITTTLLGSSNMMLIKNALIGDNSSNGYVIGTMPSIPFEVELAAYHKTVYVVSNCTKRKDAVTLKFASNDANIASMVFSAVNAAFDQPGITRVQVCRKVKSI